MVSALTSRGRMIALAVMTALAINDAAQAQCEIGKLTASDAAADDRFGIAVGISGDHAVVGAYRHDGVGAAYVYEREGVSWVEIQQLEPPAGTLQADDEYGRAVAINGDVAVVGAAKHTVVAQPPLPPIPIFNAGAAYVFRRDAGGVWQYESELTAYDYFQDDEFGHAVAVAGDEIVVGAPNEGSAPLTESGTVYVFKYDGVDTWDFQRTLRADVPGQKDYFGRSVSISGDWIVVGAEQHDPSTSTTNAGAAYVFRRVVAPVLWDQDVKLTAQIDTGEDDFYANDKFGNSVSIDGDRLVVGARTHDGAVPTSDIGAAYVYWLDDLGTPNTFDDVWSIEKKLTSTDPASSYQFGRSVSIHGELVLVGSRDSVDGLSQAGAAYLFRRFGSNWQQVEKFENSEPAATDFFGDACAVGDDYGVVGAFLDDDSGLDSGAAYLFRASLGVDCNSNGSPDDCDILDGTMQDVNGNGTPDECECSTDAECDDGISCTLDWCAVETAACAHQVITGFCLIAGDCYTHGDENPDNACQTCDSDQAPQAWSPADDGTPCPGDGVFCNGEEICFQGYCRSSGDPCSAAGLICDEPSADCVQCLSDADCHDGRICTADTCTAGQCVFASLPEGTPCGSPTETQCDRPDTCDGSGTCRFNYQPAGHPCGNPLQTPCDGPDICDGSGLCVANHKPPGSPCGDPTETECDLPDTCNGAGACSPNLRPFGAPCGDPTTNACTGPDTCDDAGQCLANHLPDDTPCPDEYWCNGEESCAQGTCISGDPPCDQPGLGCDDVSDSCYCLEGSAYVLYVDDDAAPGGDGLSWATAYQSLSSALTAAQFCDQIWVAAGTYVGNFTLALDVQVYGGFAGTETELTQRDWTANPTILDGDASGSVVTAPAGATATTRIDGFTITNGSGTRLDYHTYGGGLYLENSSPAIANNIITGNSAGHGAGMSLLSSSPIIMNNKLTGNNGYYYGGGLYLVNSSPTIAHNTITDNVTSEGSARGAGGGLYLEGSSATIVHNTITGNRAGEDLMGGLNGAGGGLYLVNSSPTIAHNTITDNVVGYWGVGGGLYLENSSPAIVHNTIMGNIADYWGGGGGLYAYKSSPTIANNNIAGNYGGDGGGLYVGYETTATITNNTITGNSASDGGGLYLEACSAAIASNVIDRNSASFGGGLYIDSSSPVMVTNTTITGNTAGAYGGGLSLWNSSPTIANTIIAFNSSGIYRFGDIGVPPLRSNCVYGNTAYDYSGLTDPTGTDGNISADPLLADLQYGNVHIQPDSPCVDAGRNMDVFGDLDIDGEPRIHPHRVDIGADESDGTDWGPGPYAIVRVSSLGNDAHDGSSWNLAKRTVQAGIDAASALGGEVWVQAGTYEGCITLHPYAYVYGGFAGEETVRDQRDWDAQITTLDGQQQDSVVTARAGHNVSAVDGFTITNGRASVGGGLYLFRSSPAIVNNTITGNNAELRGGGLRLYYSSAAITNNTIAGNSAYKHGGGLSLWGSFPTIVNNTITGNTAGEEGGGLWLYSSSPTIANTIVAFNSSGIFLDDEGGTPTLQYNCVYGNIRYDYAGLTNPTGIDGNISADPLLADPRFGNVHVQPDSPCVDAGSNTDALGDFDMDGEPRVQPPGGTVDIGADESDGTEWAPGPYAIVRVSLAGDDVHDGSSWNLAKRTVQAGINAASSLGGEVWVRAGTYGECITLRPYAHLYGGFAGREMVREDRDWAANATVLDGQRQGSVVTAQGGDRVSTIDGFTITNGSGTELDPWNTVGGGLYLAGSSPTIANNMITDNRADSGGGLYLRRSSPMIANNSITHNHASRSGGGLRLSASSPTITNNSITSNDGAAGGGLSVNFPCSPTITNNSITGNSAVSGGGLCLTGQSSPTIANNTITGNGAGDGGGVYVSYSSSTIANTIIAFNSSGIFHYGEGGSYTLQYNCVYGNIEYDYAGLPDPTGTDGNISADPLFIRDPDDGGDGWGDDPETPEVDEGANDDFGDPRLLPGSPSIDAGDNDAVPPDLADADGDGDVDEPIPFDLGGLPRFVDDPATPDTGHPGELGPPVVDMGAYEYQLPVMARLDIMPERCPNRLPLRQRGMLRIALPGTDSFDVWQVDLDSLILTRADDVGGAIGPFMTPSGLAPEITDVATPFEGELCDCHHAGRDGLDDLLLRFAGAKLIRALELESVSPETPVELTLSGNLQDGTAFEASDCVLMMHPAPPPTPSPQRKGRLR